MSIYDTCYGCLRGPQFLCRVNHILIMVRVEGSLAKSLLNEEKLYPLPIVVCIKTVIGAKNYVNRKLFWVYKQVRGNIRRL